MIKKYHVSKNLFNKNSEVLVGSRTTVEILQTGIRAIRQTAGNNRYCALKLSNELIEKTITISADISESGSNKAQIRLFYTNGNNLTSAIAEITTAGQTGYITSTITMPSSIPSDSDGIAIVLSADRGGNGQAGDYVDYADLMIAEGSTALPYEPYDTEVWHTVPYRRYENGVWVEYNDKKYDGSQWNE